MTALNTPKVDLNFTAKSFNLLGIDNKYYTLNDCRGKNGLIIMFICNHCPYVQSIISDLVSDVDLLKKGYQVNTVAIMPNDTNKYPEDSFENMINFAKKNKFTFPYLIDSTQEVAKEYGAVCTPDFFGLNANLKLCYRGRFNDTKKEKVQNYKTGSSDLFQAMKFIAETSNPPVNQKPSIGCSIKWSDSRG
ncbi:thioredoxin family protein [Wolbachia endosymbiont of Dirofilaria (Dirofilaria) immitis]|uniref:thioredoxin family protein n=1 Tax=Wolbachia endosymbiont of Dirofilaria (Dirofilaria) immitis TaxID=1812115 RepID=UPI001588ABFA|nr:thioredoxin family protein [Wolbachia endosymbiont of Dirofilaria (Dirofilaria) immitis]QKX02549.1 redoxin domain-containing protein [Wolbachia endosymbiont of Dirofilaria (Dirofilaria) immitis]